MLYFILPNLKVLKLNVSMLCLFSGNGIINMLFYVYKLVLDLMGI
nr:MAG TPA: hypothetical protein [Caudoviricetes sp.]DAZ45658.1 MAG TPA: hypothetical protein [Caudoviricetes sp.]